DGMNQATVRSDVLTSDIPVQVDYFLRNDLIPPGTVGNEIFLGSSTDVLNGFSVSFQVPVGGIGFIWAEPHFTNDPSEMTTEAAVAPFFAQPITVITKPLQESTPGSFLVFPIFDVIGGNQTKIRFTCNGVTGTRVRVTYICQPGPGTSAFCPSFDESFP